MDYGSSTEIAVMKLQVFTFYFVPFAVDFVAFAVEFMPFAIGVHWFAIDFGTFALEFVTFAQEFLIVTLTAINQPLITRWINYCLIESYLQQLYFNKIMKQLLHLVFVFTAAANLVTDKFLCKYDEFNCKTNKLLTNSIANRTSSTAKATDSTANGVTNSIAKTCNAIINAINIIAAISLISQLFHPGF